MKILTYNELQTLIGREVLVVDCAINAEVRVPEPQVCKVEKHEKKCQECGHDYSTISLENEDYSFDYDVNGNCLDGEFVAYDIENFNTQKFDTQRQEQIFNRLIEMYIKNTTIDQQMFCGCRPDDCELWNTEKCKDCVIGHVLNDLKGLND